MQLSHTHPVVCLDTIRSSYKQRYGRICASVLKYMFFIVFRIQNVSMKIFFVSKYFFGCAWPIRTRGYAWIWLDRPRNEDMLDYSHLGLVCCLLAEGAGLWLAEGNLPVLPFFFCPGAYRTPRSIPLNPPGDGDHSRWPFGPHKHGFVHPAGNLHVLWPGVVLGLCQCQHETRFDLARSHR